jgi:hypothetical protein
MRQTLFNRLPRQNFEIGAVTTDASKTRRVLQSPDRHDCVCVRDITGLTVPYNHARRSLKNLLNDKTRLAFKSGSGLVHTNDVRFSPLFSFRSGKTVGAS